MKTFFLSVGSNIEPEKNIPACLDLLRRKFNVKKISSIYESDPVGPCEGGKFWNLAVEIQTELGTERLRLELKKIETELGRKRDPTDKFAPRTIDLDLLPQPGYQELAFVMIPLAEIAPDVQDRETGKSWKELAERLKNPAGPRKLRKAVSS